jgi:sulfur-oxidizing protein SoxZ
MKQTIKLQTRWDGAGLKLRVMIQHPMETGRRLDETSGLAIPAHYVRDLKVDRNGEPLIEAVLSTGVSRNPFFSFDLDAIRPGDVLGVRWTDNLGNTDSGSITVAQND